MQKIICSLARLKIANNAKFNVNNILSTSSCELIKIPFRTTFILRRRYPPPLIRKTADPSQFKIKKKRNMIYEVEKYLENTEEGEIKVILKSYVEGIGHEGDIVSVKRSVAYDKLLMHNLAEYATPEALNNLKNNQSLDGHKAETKDYSGLFVPRTMNVLASRIISVTMNKDNKWVLEPWHVRVSFRKAGIHLNDDCIELPAKKIEGPDMNLEGKEFLVTITINKKEKVQVRCRLHHWSTDIIHRLPPTPLHWTEPTEPLFEEDIETLTKMPLPPKPVSKDSLGL